MLEQVRQLSEDWGGLHPTVRLVIVFVGAIAILKWFPLVELLKLAIYIILIPLGAYHAFMWCAKNAKEEIEKLKGKGSEDE